MVAGSTSLPEGQAMCRPCRRAGLTVRKITLHKRVCMKCGVEFERQKQTAKYCSRACGAHAGSVAGTTAFRPETHPKIRRAKLESRAPGLSNKRRLALLAEWRRKGAICVYCRASAADTVDHVVPLVLGGTNYEGNLAPCCRRCNSSKAGKTVAEWRHDRRVSRHVVPMPKKVAKAPKPKPEKPSKACPICASVHRRLKYCSDACMSEANRRFARERSRAKRGIRFDPNDLSLHSIGAFDGRL